MSGSSPSTIDLTRHFFGGFALLLAGCNSDSGQAQMSVTQVGACGEEGDAYLSGGYSSGDYALEENGLLSSRSSSYNDTGQNYESASFVECKKGLTINLTGSSGSNYLGNTISVDEFLHEIQSENVAFDLISIANFADSFGFRIDYMQNFRFADSSGLEQGAVCGCENFFPGSSRNWPKSLRDSVTGQTFETINLAIMTERLEQIDLALEDTGMNQ